MKYGTWELAVAYDVLAAAVEVCLTSNPRGVVDHRIEQQGPGSVRFRLAQDNLGDLGTVSVRKLAENRCQLAIDLPNFCSEDVTRHMRDLVIPALFGRLNRERIWSDSDPSEAQRRAVAQATGKAEPLMANPIETDEPEQVPASVRPKWWPKNRGTIARWRRDYPKLSKAYRSTNSILGAALTVGMDRETASHILKWGNQSPEPHRRE